jgi:arylsulfatase A-like enzyme/Flp pilus assembly protein TadD
VARKKKRRSSEKESDASPPRMRRAPLLVALSALVVVALGLFATRYVVRSVIEARAPEVPSGRLKGDNVLFVTIDTLRPDRLGCYGSASGLTPHLDRLASEGIVFENVLAHVPLTLPSHSSIFTAKFPTGHGVHDNGTFRLADGSETLAARLHAAGYETAAFVGAFVLDARFGLSQGFDLYDDYYGEKRTFASFTELERPAERVLAPAERFLALEHERPWLVWVHLYDPHAPYDAPEPFRSAHSDDPYGAEVAHVDSALGSFLDRLRERGLLDRTLVVVAGDHGESLGEHGELTHGTFAYDSTLSVPWILWARGIAPRRFSPRVRLVDVMPTVVDLLGVEPPASIDGASLRASLGDPSGYVPRDSYFEALNTNLTRDWAPLRGIVKGRDKFIDLPIPELYDLADDPAEKRNLAPSRAALAAELRSALEGLEKDEVAIENAPTDEETLRRLESLGYLVRPGSRRETKRYTESDDPKRLASLVSAHEQATTLFQQGRTEDALALLRDLLARQPKSSFAAQKLAYALHQVGRVDEAVHVLEEAVTRGVTDRSLVALLGSYLVDVGRAEKARILLEAVVASHPDYVDARNTLGVAYARLGRTADAEREFSRVLELDPSSVSAYNNLGSLALGRGDAAKAVVWLERAIVLDPDSPSASNGLGVARARSGNLDGAIEAWRRAVELSPTAYDALLNLAMALSERSHKEATPYLERFAREAPPSRYRQDIEKARALLRAWRETSSSGSERSRGEKKAGGVSSTRSSYRSLPRTGSGFRSSPSADPEPRSGSGTRSRYAR